jgi:hypothetical protein
VKIAACLSADEGLARTAVQRMLAAQRLRPAQSPHVVGIASGALGWLTTFDRATAIPMVRTAANGNVLLVSGVPVDLVGDLDHRLTRVAEGDYRGAAQSLSQLDGAFAIVFWDSAHRKLVVVTDFLGMQPLYSLMLPDGFCLATEIKGAAASGHCPVELDPLGWAMLVCLGHFAEDLTSVRGVRQIPPASVMIYDVVTRQWETSTYWRWPDARPGLRLESVDTGEILDRFRLDLLACEVHHRSAVVLLSGGFDSRLILATLAREGRRPRGLTLLHADEKDDADRRLAVRLARAYGIQCEFIPPTPNFYSSAGYLDYVVMNDMATPSFGLFIAQLASAIAGRAEAVWEGIAPGSVLRTVRQGRGGFDAFFRSQSTAFDAKTWEALHQIFARELVLSMQEGFHEFMARSQRGFTDDEFGVAEFVARNRMRNRTGPNPLKVYANDVAPFTPGFSRGLWELTAGIPFEAREGFALYLEIFRKHFPDLDGLPFCTDRNVYKARGASSIEYSVLRFRKWLIEHDSVVRIGRRLGLRPLVSGEAHDTIGRTIRAVEIGHPDLNGDGVASLLKDEGRTVDPVKRMARTWLFYWQLWRGVMDGSLRARQAELEGAATGERIL